MHARVLVTQWLTPSLVRLELGDGDLAEFSMPDATDAYVNVAIPPAGAPYGEVFEPARREGRAPRAHVARAPALHGPVLGPAGAAADRRLRGARRPSASPGPWAAAARPGSVLVFEGPSGGYRPDPDADWHLLVGDESALPAIAASLEALPPGAPRGGAAGLRRPRARARPAQPRRPRRGLAAPRRRRRGRRPAPGRGPRPGLPAPAACTPSCTARPRRSGRSAGTCSSSAA